MSRWTPDFADERAVDLGSLILADEKLSIKQESNSPEKDGQLSTSSNGSHPLGAVGPLDATLRCRGCNATVRLRERRSQEAQSAAWLRDAESCGRPAGVRRGQPGPLRWRGPEDGAGAARAHQHRADGGHLHQRARRRTAQDRRGGRTARPDRRPRPQPAKAGHNGPPSKSAAIEASPRPEPVRPRAAQRWKTRNRRRTHRCPGDTHGPHTTEPGDERPAQRAYRQGLEPRTGGLREPGPLRRCGRPDPCGGGGPGRGQRPDPAACLVGRRRSSAGIPRAVSHSRSVSSLIRASCSRANSASVLVRTSV